MIGYRMTWTTVDSPVMEAIQPFRFRENASRKLRKLGVDLQYRKSSAKPWLTNITDGLVLQWNQVSYPMA